MGYSFSFRQGMRAAGTLLPGPLYMAFTAQSSGERMAYAAMAGIVGIGMGTAALVRAINRVDGLLSEFHDAACSVNPFGSTPKPMQSNNHVQISTDLSL